MSEKNKFLTRVGKFLLIASVIVFTVVNILFAIPRGKIHDLEAFVYSGKAARLGMNPYDTGVMPHEQEPQFNWGYNPNLNPPVSLLFFDVISVFPAYSVYLVLWITSFILYALLVWLLVRAYRPSLWLTLWAFSLVGLWGTLALGQIYIFLLALSLGAWLLFKNDHPVLAGLLIGFMAAWKVNYLIWPVLLFLAGQRKVGLVAGLTFIFASLLPALIYGPEVYLQWLALVTQTSAASHTTNASLFSLATRLGMPAFGAVLCILTLLGLAIYVWRRSPAPLETSSLALTVAMLASPIAWVYYSIFLLPLFFLFRWNGLIGSAAFLLTVPVVLVNWMGLGPKWLLMTGGSLYAWAIILLFAGLFVKKHSLE